MTKLAFATPFDEILSFLDEPIACVQVPVQLVGEQQDLLFGILERQAHYDAGVAHVFVVGGKRLRPVRWTRPDCAKIGPGVYEELSPKPRRSAGLRLKRELLNPTSVDELYYEPCESAECDWYGH